VATLGKEHNERTKSLTRWLFPSTQQAKASRDIMGCRTAALGGNASACEECGYVTVYYNSCRNRHCPMCQGINRAIWVDKRSKDILNAPYFHVVFTMPQELQSLIYQNQELLYGLMYKAVAETLSELSQDKKYLGSQIGFISFSTHFQAAVQFPGTSL